LSGLALMRYRPRPLLSEVRSIATSLLAVLARPVGPRALARALLEQFERAYDLLPLNAEEVLAGWRERDLTERSAGEALGCRGPRGSC